jgi:hypothetical protein
MKIDQNREEVYDKQGGLLINLKDIRLQKMKGFEAADILEREINKPGSGDTSSNFSFVIHVPVIHVNPIGDHHTGDVFFINGTTNLPTGEKLDLEIDICCPLQPHGVVIPPRFESTTIVQPGFCGNNSWSVFANASRLYPNDQGQDWLVTVYNWDLHAAGYAIFNISAASNQTPLVIQSPNSTTNSSEITS